MMPSALTSLLAMNMDVPRDSIVADLGCGCGILSIIAAKLGAKQVYAIDVNPHALRDTTFNAKINGVSEIVSPVLLDLRKIGNQFNSKIDVVVSNPPQMPTGHYESSRNWLAISRDGGTGGNDTVDLVINKSQQLLRQSRIAKLEFVVTSLIGIASTLKQLQKLGYTTSIVANSLVPEPVTKKQPRLEGRSDLRSEVVYERLVVVHAVYHFRS